jgi:hypothetical protein
MVKRITFIINNDIIIMDYKFSKGLDDVFKQSKTEAKKLNSEFLNTEHLLLGIIKTQNSAKDLLVSLEVDLTQVRRKIETLGSVNLNVFGDKAMSISFTKMADQAVKRSELECRQYKGGEINTVHLLLGILYKFLPQKIEEFGFILISSFLLYYFIFIIIPAEGQQFYFTFPDNYIEAQGILGNAIKLIQKNGEAPTAAFPSSHVGISWIVIFWLYQNFRKSVKYFLPFVILLMFSTVYIKAHYFVDVVAGFLTAPIVFFLTFKLYKFLNRKLNVHLN